MRVMGKRQQLVHIPANQIILEGMLKLPEDPHGLVLFAHGSGSSRHSPRNNQVADALRDAGFGTLLIDLLSQHEETYYNARFDIGLLAQRLLAASRWLMSQPATRELPLGYFGASTGAAAALSAAAELGDAIGAVVSRGGRPDLAGDSLARVRSPTLLIVGSSDPVVIGLNQQAAEQLKCPHELATVPGASHLFEEPGALEQVAKLAVEWFGKHLHKRAKVA